MILDDYRLRRGFRNTKKMLALRDTLGPMGAEVYKLLIELCLDYSLGKADCKDALIRRVNQYYAEYDLEHIAREVLDNPDLFETDGQKIWPVDLAAEVALVQGRTGEKTRSPHKDSFEKFWELYPRHRRKNKKKCKETLWPKIKPEEVPAILAGLERQVQSWDWTKEGGEFIPLPETFLRNSRWEDECKPLEQGPSCLTCRYRGNRNCNDRTDEERANCQAYVAREPAKR